MQYADPASKAGAGASRQHSAAERIAVPEKQSNVPDRPPAGAAARTLQEMMAQSPRVAAQNVLHARLHSSPRMVAQRRLVRSLMGEAAQRLTAEEEQPLQGEFKAAQRRQANEEDALQMQAGLPVNDDAGLEHEADVMGARAAAGLMQFADEGKDGAASAGRPTRFSRSYPRALPASWQTVAQLVNLPPDSTGELRTMKFTVNKNKSGEKEITGQELQTQLIEALSKTKDVKEGFGYRLVSFRYAGKGAFEKDMSDYHEENHGMLPWPGNIDNNLGSVRALMHGTLNASGQLAYLDENFLEIAKTHAIIIDVDWYLKRTQSDVGFHKDSRGTTLFVNLTYNNPQAMQGAATKFDREGQPALEKSFPAEVQKDLARRRESYEAIKPDDKVGDLKEEEVKAYARLSFSDPSVWHSTPLLGHRVEKLPPPQDDDTLEKYLVRAGYPPYLYNGIVNYYATTTPEECQAVYDDFVNDGETVENDDELEEKLQEAKYSSEDIYGYWEKYTPEEFWSSGKIDAIDKYNRHGISDEIKPVNTEKLNAEVKTRGRRLSVDLTGRPKLQENLDEEASRPRTFIRTWVRLVPKPVNV